MNNVGRGRFCYVVVAIKHFHTIKKIKKLFSWHFRWHSRILTDYDLVLSTVLSIVYLFYLFLDLSITIKRITENFEDFSNIYLEVLRQQV